MLARKIVRIDEQKCDGCGLCVDVCHEGAIQIIDGKAKLVSETYCDGLGACLADCPQDAITIEERVAAPFDAKAVEEHLAAQRQQTSGPGLSVVGGCPGSAPQRFQTGAPSFHPGQTAQKPAEAGRGCPGSALESLSGAQSRATVERPNEPSQLGHWPVQLMLVPPGAPFLRGADILICADCVPFAVPEFHRRYLAGKSLLVGCPKLDNLQFYLDKLQAIFHEARPRSITVLKMEVPCCAGIAHATIQARNVTSPDTEVAVHTISLRGEEILCERIPTGCTAS